MEKLLQKYSSATDKGFGLGIADVQIALAASAPNAFGVKPSPISESRGAELVRALPLPASWNKFFEERD